MEATVSIYLEKRYVNSDKKHTVKIRITFNRKQKYYNTDVTLNQKEFDKIISGKYLTPIENNISLKIKEYETKATKIIEELPIFTFDKFEERYYIKKRAVNDVYGAYEDYINELISMQQIGTAANYKCALNSLKDFKKSLVFADVTKQFLKRYEKSMRDKGRTDTTISMYLRTLRTIFNRSEVDKSIYPFGKNKFEIPVGRNVKKSLTMDEIAMIYNHPAIPNSPTDQARDYWIFMFLCNGMNVKDFCNLKQHNIKGDFIEYEREKTKQTKREQKKITVSLKAESKAIIQKWGKISIDKNDYLFPHYHKNDSAERKHFTSHNVTKFINKHIKKIVSDLGIDKDVTTYFARHSFATILKRSGANISMISDLLGHSSIAVTENYLDGFEQEQIQLQTNVLTEGLHKTKAG